MTADQQPTFWRLLRRKVKSAALPVALLGLSGVFVWAATQGEHGLIMRAQRIKDLDQAKARLVAARAEQALWTRKVAGLDPSKLDKDALDELARSQLLQADPNEIVVQYPDNEKLFQKR